MPEEIVTLVRLPVAEAVDALRKRHHISEPFSEVRLEDNFLAFYFVRSAEPASEAPVSLKGETISTRSHGGGRRRRARKRRNRMKTRGWPVVTKFLNSKGQTAVIYQPFADALSKEGLTRRDQRAVVEDVLRANGNKPSDASIEYFLANTLEFLRKSRTEVTVSP